MFCYVNHICCNMNVFSFVHIIILTRSCVKSGIDRPNSMNELDMLFSVAGENAWALACDEPIPCEGPAYDDVDHES